MKSYSKKVRTLVYTLLLFCTACGDADLLKFDKISDSIDWQPDFTVPLAYGKYELWDLLNQYPENGEDTIILNKDGKLFIQYVEKDIFKFNINDIFTLPEQTLHFQKDIDLPTIPSIPGAPTIEFPGIDQTYDISQVIDLKEGCLLERLSISMKCSYSLPKMPFKYTVTATFENIKEGGRPVTIIETSDKEPVSDSRDINTAEIDMASSPNTVKMKLKIKADAGQQINPADLADFKITFALSKLNYNWGEGKIAPQTIDIENDRFTMDVDFWNSFEGEFHFADPKLFLVVSDIALGVEVAADMNLTASGNGKQKTLVAAPLIFDFAGINESPTTWKTLSVGYDTTNSNIAELLSLPPKDYIEYGGKIIVNPEGGKVFISKKSSVKADIKVEIPLSLSATNLVFADTIKDIDISDADKIKKAKIKLTAENGIPLGLEAGNLLLLNERYVCIDTVKVTKLLDAPQVDASGNVIAPAKSTNDIELSLTNIASLNRTKYIVISVKAQTSNQGTIPVSIKPTDVLELRLSLEAKFDMNNL